MSEALNPKIPASEDSSKHKPQIVPSAVTNLPQNFSNTLHLFQGLFKFFFFSRNRYGEFTFVSEQIEELLQYSPEEFKNDWENYLSEDLVNEDVWLTRNETYFKDKLVTYNLEIKSKSGQLIWLEVLEQPALDSEGKVIRYDGIALDFTSKKSLENRLFNREKRFREIIQSSPVGIFHVDSDNLLLYVNSTFQNFIGEPLCNILGKPWWDFIHPEDQEKVRNLWEKPKQNDQEIVIECRLKRPDQEILWTQLRSRFLLDESGKITFVTVENITDLKNAHENKSIALRELLGVKKQLEETVRTDPLTGLLNRRGCKEKMDEQLNQFKRYKRPFSVLILDVDHFKSINDTFGHDAGDVVLVDLSRLMENSIRQQDFLCRWGGEEFVLLLTETAISGAKEIAERLRSSVETHHFTYLDNKIPVTISIGISHYSEINQDVDSVIKMADNRLYVAKRSGRNRVIHSDQDQAEVNSK